MSGSVESPFAHYTDFTILHTILHLALSAYAHTMYIHVHAGIGYRPGSILARIRHSFSDSRSKL